MDVYKLLKTDINSESSLPNLVHGLVLLTVILSIVVIREHGTDLLGLCREKMSNP